MKTYDIRFEQTRIIRGNMQIDAETLQEARLKARAVPVTDIDWDRGFSDHTSYKVACIDEVGD